MIDELHVRFQKGILINAQAQENVLNNQLCVLEDGKIRRANSGEEWLTKQVVYVCDEMSSTNHVIPQGEYCRCFLVAVIAL